jgi:hydrogenase expression/formation protein HypC
MCIGLPGKITRLNGHLAVVKMNGMTVEAVIDLIDKPRLGDYVIVHAGFAIQRLDKQEARETLNLISQISNDAP